jgi:hypothetical protein
MKRLHQNCNHAFNVFDELDCRNWEEKKVKKGYFENTKYIDKLLNQRMKKYQKEKEILKKNAKTIKKRKTKAGKKKSMSTTAKANNLGLKKDESLNFYFGEEIRNDQVILKKNNGKEIKQKKMTVLMKRIMINLKMQDSIKLSQL